MNIWIMHLRVVNCLFLWQSLPFGVIKMLQLLTLREVSTVSGFIFYNLVCSLNFKGSKKKIKNHQGKQ